MCRMKWSLITFTNNGCGLSSALYIYFMIINWPSQAKICLRAYADSEGPVQPNFEASCDFKTFQASVVLRFEAVRNKHVINWETINL